MNPRILQRAVPGESQPGWRTGKLGKEETIQLGEHFRIRPRRGNSSPRNRKPPGIRSLSAILIATLLLAVTGCGPIPIDQVDVRTAGPFCVFLALFGVIGPFGTTGEAMEGLTECIGERVGGASLSSEGAFSTMGLQLAPGVTHTGEALLAVFSTEGRVRATEFPEVVLGVPQEGLNAAGTDVVAVLVASQVLGEDLELASEIFQLMKVTLRNAEGDQIAEASAKFGDEEIAAFVGFKDVEPQPGLEAVISFAGGAIQDSLVMLNVGATLPFDDADAEASSSAKRITGEASPLVPGNPVSESFSPAEVAVANSALGVSGPAKAQLVFYRAKGSVKAKKFPKMVLDLPENGEGRVDVDAGFTVLTEEFEPPKKNWRPKSITATLLKVENGMTEKVGTSKGKTDKDGYAEVSFEEIDTPKNGHLRLVIRLKGRRVKDALIIGYGSAS